MPERVAPQAISPEARYSAERGCRRKVTGPVQAIPKHMEDLYMENILDHYKHPRNAGRLEDATLRAKELNPSCGDAIELFLKLDACDRVEEVKFDGHGCAVSQASISLMTERLKGRPLAEAMAIGEKDILGLLGIDVGPMRMKCAMLSLRTLKSALALKK